MAKVKTVGKSRTEFVCSACNRVIPVGSAYKSITLFRQPTQRFHTGCAIPRGATTSSEYLKTVYDLADSANKQAILIEDFELESLEEPEEFIASVTSDLEGLRDELESSIDNLEDTWSMEALEANDVYTRMKERFEALENAITELEDIDASDADLTGAIEANLEVENWENNVTIAERALNDYRDDEEDAEDDDEWQAILDDLEAELEDAEEELEEAQNIYTEKSDAIKEIYEEVSGILEALDI